MAKILLTEDDESVRSFVARALEMDGHSVLTAEDGEDGYDRLIEHEGNFDLLLTDIKMPFMDGIELAHSAKAHFPDLKILLMTGYADQQERADELSDVVIDVVSKPFNLSEIRTAVGSAVKVVRLNTSNPPKENSTSSDGYTSAERDNNIFSAVRKVST